MELGTVHSTLLNLGFQVSDEDLKNPTEAFMVNFISQFFQRFHIDFTAIKRITLEQTSALRVTDTENADIVSLINLREVIFVIGNKIFIKDFTINDITSPGPKRTRKHLKFVANFTLYARNTLQNIHLRADKVLLNGQYINELRKKKQEIIELTNNNATEISKTKDHNEKLKEEIASLRIRNQERKLHITKLDTECKFIGEKTQQLIERNQIKRGEIKKLTEISEQLKAKIVKEPESIKQRLKDLEEECNNKKEKRTEVQKAIQVRKPLIQNLERAVDFVEKQHIKLAEVIELQKKITEYIQIDESLKRQMEEASRVINLEAISGHDNEETITNKEINKIEAECEQKLSKLRNLYNELTIENKALETKMMSLETRQLELYNERNELRGTILELESEVNRFLHQCQELYNKDVKQIEVLYDTAEEQIQLLHDINYMNDEISEQDKY